MNFLDHVFSQPGWLVAWMLLFVGMHFLALPFALKDRRARWIVVATIFIIIFGGWLYRTYGYTRIIGLSHIIAWTPLLIYLWKRRDDHPERRWTYIYIAAFMLIISLSYVVDCIDVVRFVAGDRAVVT